jgi:hypothetical protein
VVSIVQAKFCGPIDVGRATKSLGRNAERLIEAEQHCDPDNVFGSAIPAAGRWKRRAHPCCRGCSANGRLDTMRTGVDPNGHQMSEQMPWRPL